MSFPFVHEMIKKNCNEQLGVQESEKMIENVKFCNAQMGGKS